MEYKEEMKRLYDFCEGLQRQIKETLDSMKPTKFADVQVGDWVELSNGETTIIKSIENDILVEYNYTIFDYYGKQTNGKRNLYLVRIVPPSEVKVKLTLEGTVEIAEMCQDKQFDLLQSDGFLNHIRYADIAPDQAEQVRQLLKAQEDE